MTWSRKCAGSLLRHLCQTIALVRPESPAHLLLSWKLRACPSEGHRRGPGTRGAPLNWRVSSYLTYLVLCCTAQFQHIIKLLVRACLTTLAHRPMDHVTKEKSSGRSHKPVCQLASVDRHPASVQPRPISTAAMYGRGSRVVSPSTRTAMQQCEISLPHQRCAKSGGRARDSHLSVPLS